jgi:hypothetical protein
MTQKSSASRLSPFFFCAFLLCLFSFDSAVQGQPRYTQKDRLPRVGTIKDYPATGLMTGCGNLYFYPAQAASLGDAYIFLSAGDGSNAWMNLGGRDVRLQKIKSLTREGRKPWRYLYRSGTMRVSILIESFKPETASVEEGDSMFKMKITLSRGRNVRIVRAVGDSDC